jgi:hypothetical protein
MHSPLILPVARRSISPESSFVNLCSLRRPRYSFSRFNSRLKVIYRTAPTHFFFKASSYLSHHDSSCLKNQDPTHANHGFFFPILALLWNPGKDWLVQRRDAVAKKGDRGVEGRKGCRARHEGRRRQVPLGRKLSSPMDGDVDLEEAHRSGKKESPVCVSPRIPPLGSRTIGSSGKKPASKIRKISNLL